jgi:hypothetical protein
VPADPTPSWITGRGPRQRRARAALLGLLGGALLLARAPRAEAGDLAIYRAAGHLAVQGRAEAAYDPAALAAEDARERGGARRLGGFLYSPIYLLPAAGLAGLPMPAAAAAHRLAGALLLAAGLALVLARLETPLLQAGLLLSFVLSHTAWTQLGYQNWGILLFVGVAGALAAGRTGRSVVAGIAWALAGHLKLFAALIAAPLATTRWRRQLVAAALVALLLVALSLPWIGSEPWWAWLGSLSDLSTRGVTPYYNKVSLAAALARFEVDPRAWLAPREAVAVGATRALAACGMVALALAAARLRRDPERLAAASIAAVLLFVPQIWDHTEILLFAALPALPRRALAGFAAALAATVAYGPLVGAGLAGVFAGSAAPARVAALLLLYPALNLALLAAVLRAGPRREAVSDA